MKKISLIVMFALVCNFAIAQIQPTLYRGAFAPAPTAMWTQGWTNFDPNNATYGNVTTAVTADITSNTTWRKTQVYELTRLITVRNNATLTIEAGTVIRSSALASALVVTRGSKLVANGTVTEPIVFTSKNAAGSRSRGDWGGIVLLGKARYNINNGVNYIEGISQNINTEFGGGLTPDDNDNSGSLKYVRIEFAGFVFSPNNELNGLTLGAVGKGTTIEHVQVSYSNDDSFEWFGGSVNCKYLVALNGLDDDFDVDNGFKGIVQFGLSIKDPSGADISTSEAFEVDNNSGGTATAVAWGDTTSPIFSNITCVGPVERQVLTNGGTLNSFHDKSLRIRRASAPKIFNSIFVGHAKGLVINDLLTGANATADRLKFKNNLVASALHFQATSGLSSSTVPSTTDLATWFATPAFDNKTFATSTGLLVRPYDTTNGQNYLMITDNNDTVNCDLRPSSTDATTGASFTDASFTDLIAQSGAPRVNDRTFCKGEIATALTADLTATGVSLRWYTTAIATTFTTTAPVPSTSAVGERSFFVAEVDQFGNTSAKATIKVTVKAAPLVALANITSTVTNGGAAATAAVGPFIGTLDELTYTVPASEEASVTGYRWTVPLGATIMSGQGTNTISVHYKNVASGLFKVGNIGVQAINADGCGGKIKTLAITAALPKAPAAVIMTNSALPLVVNNTTNVSSPRVLRSFAEYMGTNTPLTVTATAVAGVTAGSSYAWEIPTGVNVLDLGTQTDANGTSAGLDLVQNFNAYPFTVPVSVPGAGNVYYQITTKAYDSGIKVVTGRIIQNARAATGNLPAIAAFNIPLTNVTNDNVRVNPPFPIVFATNQITVNFAGVTAANTHNFTSAAGTSTNSLRIGVSAGNFVGASLSTNSTLINPTTSSTAKLLTLTAIAPTAVKTVSGQIAALCGESSYNYTITPSPLASSYVITAPAGSVVTSASMMSNATNTLETRDLTFTVMYPTGFVATTIAPQSLLVSAKNGIGTSLPVTVRLSTLMSAIGNFTGSAGIATFTRAASQTFTVPAVLGATNYVWTLANGATGTSTTNTITVDFSAVSNSVTSTRISVVAQNACGASSVAKSISLRSAVPATKLATVTVNATEVYPNPVSNIFNVDVTASSAGVLDIAIYSLEGNVAVNAKSIALKEGLNTISENVSTLRKGIYIVQLVNSSNGEIITKKLIKN